MMKSKVRNISTILILLFLTACGGPPLAQPEGQDTATATIAATEETTLATAAVSEEPLLEPTATLAAIDELLVATPVSPVATPTATKPSFMAQNLKVSN